ncbi:MAG: SRPBCC family protein [Acidimicrobiales bacterium]
MADVPPLIDVHRVEIDSDAAQAWAGVVDVVGRLDGAAPRLLADVLGCTPRRASGDAGAAGSTIPGFAVEVSDPPHTLRLAGRHRFAHYVLEFEVAELGPGRVEVSATSSGSFGGPAGLVYRLLVLRSGFHVLAVEAMLRRVKRVARHRVPAGR